MSVLENLKKRGYFYQSSNEAEIEKLFKNPQGKSFYIGFDPTADSLHLGSMYGVMVATELAKLGLRPIIVLGGGTGLIGDPSGKTEMRQLLTAYKISENVKSIEKQMRAILPNDSNPLFLNNADWIKDINLVDFLRDIGKHFSINRMLTQDSVKMRMEKGISYLEFSYMLFQAYDFAYLNKKYDCMLQIGGADQWGNMVMGIDLTRRLYQNAVNCFTFPLIQTSVIVYLLLIHYLYPYQLIS